MSIYPESVSRLRRLALADRVGGMGGWGGWRGGEYTAAPPRVCIEAETTGKMSGWGGWINGWVGRWMGGWMEGWVDMMDEWVGG